MRPHVWSHQKLSLLLHVAQSSFSEVENFFRSSSLSSSLSVANLQTSECWRCQGTELTVPPPLLPTPPVFLRFYNLMLSPFFFSALMNTLQSPVMEQRPRLVSFPRSNHQQSNRTSQTGAGTRPDQATHTLADLVWSLVSRSHSHSVLILKLVTDQSKHWLRRSVFAAVQPRHFLSVVLRVLFFL